MSRGIMFTTLLWHDSRGCEVETRARVIYSRCKGYKGDSINPPEAPSIEILSITSEPRGIDIPASFETDSVLLDECMADWDADEADAAEYRAQARRDDALMGDDQ